VPPIVAPELGQHRLEPAAEEQVQEERLDDVVAVMAEHDLAHAVLAREAVQGATPKPRAQPALGLAVRDDAPDHAVS